MSSILKALKKLEEEKSARRAGVDVAKGIVKSTPIPPAKRRWLFPLAVVGAAFSAALLTYILMGRQPEHERIAEPSAVPPVQNDIKKTGSDTMAGERSISVRKTHPAREPSVTIAPKPFKPSATKVVQKKSLPAKSLLSRTPDTQIETKIPGEGQTAQKNTNPPLDNYSEVGRKPLSSDLPVLRISGIAWNKDGSERFAVVNGVPVSEGATVGGAVVERIFKDKVRFSYEKSIFDVAVGNEMR